MRQPSLLGAVRLGWIGLLGGAIAACGASDGVASDPCSGRTCGLADHLYLSGYTCPVAGSVHLSWRLLEHCVRQCESAAGLCNVSGCSVGCAADHGSGGWISCVSELAGGQVTASGCFMRESGLDGETVPCDCQ